MVGVRKFNAASLGVGVHRLHTRLPNIQPSFLTSMSFKPLDQKACSIDRARCLSSMIFPSFVKHTGCEPLMTPHVKWTSPNVEMTVLIVSCSIETQGYNYVNVGHTISRFAIAG